MNSSFKRRIYRDPRSVNDSETIAALFVRTRRTVPDHFHSLRAAAAVPAAVHVTVRTTTESTKFSPREEKRVRVRERDPPARQLAPAF